jgi:hypothetical protein
VSRYGKIIRNRCSNACGIRLSSGAEGFVSVGDKVWNGDCRQDADDGDNDHQLDQGKAFLVSETTQHGFFLLLLCLVK